MHPGDLLLIFTDGLPDSVFGESPESRLREVLTGEPRSSLANLEGLVDPTLNQDDITILILKRAAIEASDDTNSAGG
jgi:serine phosphatase RsbU (regulator of sigma subunit)